MSERLNFSAQREQQAAAQAAIDASLRRNRTTEPTAPDEPVVGDQFKVVSADDPAKFDHELHCMDCGERLCDVEAGDSLNSLVAMAQLHACKGPEIRQRLEYLRGELRAERISQDELSELESLAPHIDPSDVEMLEAAGVPEQPSDAACEMMRHQRFMQAGGSLHDAALNNPGHPAHSRAVEADRRGDRI